MSPHRNTAARKKRLSVGRESVVQMRPVILKIAREYGATNIRVFGSFARGTQTKRSDIDLLVDLPDHMSLLDLSGLKIDLEDALKREVDVVPARSVKPALREAIFSEARPL
ncbi:hypothetical protein AUJ46_05685 [Candidatus Peregrinibacteria bacterium CG1_02_54_53]|nr:MAG: hypothetical protein AUJ46_05685 [Candidatus Peregrinibacteria bacterium CG1_02_54_53]